MIMSPGPTIRTREQILEQHAGSVAGASQKQIDWLVRQEMLSDELLELSGPMPSCPAWCTYEPGHDYDSMDVVARELHRHHYLAVTPAANVTIVQMEINREGVVTLGRIQISIEEDATGKVDGAELRLRAAEMLRVADRYDEILAGADSA